MTASAARVCLLRACAEADPRAAAGFWIPHPDGATATRQRHLGGIFRHDRDDVVP